MSAARDILIDRSTAATPPPDSAATDAADSLTPSRSGAGHATGGGPAALPGQSFGRYRIQRLIGQGGMGAVYEALQENPRRTVALKVIRPGSLSPDLLRRFELESQVLARLQHPGIAHVYEAGMAPGGTAPGGTAPGGTALQSGDPPPPGGAGTTALQSGDSLPPGGAGTTALQDTPIPYFAMEFIQGIPITRYCDDQKLDQAARLRLVSRLCDAVQHAHQRAVIHRDLKPANILVDSAGQPKILDFGVARLTESDLQTTTMHTEVGQIVGTLAYMSPEQAAGDPGELDTRSDVYSLGVITYQLLTGRLPHDLAGKPVYQALRQIRELDPPTLSTISRALRGDVETIVAKALDKDKSRRYQTAGDLAADIERHLRHEPISARPAGTWYHAAKFARRNKVLVVGIAATFLALLIGLAGTLWKAREARRALVRSEENAHLANLRLGESLGKQAQLARQRGQWKDVIAAADEAMRVGVHDPFPLLFLRLEATSNLDPRDVDRELERIESIPGAGDHRATLELWRAEPRLSKAGEPDAIVAHARRALDLGLRPEDAAYARAIVAETIPESIGHLRRTLEADPFHSRANQLIIMLLGTQGLIEESIQRLEAWRLVEPDNVTAAVYLTQLYGLVGRFEDGKRLIASIEGSVEQRQIDGLNRALNALEIFNSRSVAIGVEPWRMGEMLMEVGPTMLGFSAAYTESTVPGAAVDPVQQGMTPALRKFQGLVLKYLATGWMKMGKSSLTTCAEMRKICPSPMITVIYGQALVNAGRHREASEILASVTGTGALLQLVEQTRAKGGLLSSVRWFAAEKDGAGRELARAHALEFGRQIMARGPVDPVFATDLALSGAMLGEDLLLHAGLTDLRTWQHARPVDYARALAFHALNKNHLGVLFLASHGLTRTPGDPAITRYRDDALAALRNGKNPAILRVLGAGGFLETTTTPPADPG